MESSIIVRTDGASRGNPGAAAIAYVIVLPEETVEFAQTIGQTTNNQAEYRALLAALTRLEELELKNSTIECFADSELMVRQVIGVYRVKDAGIAPVYAQVISARKVLESHGNVVSFTAVRRSENKRADELCNLALDGRL